MLQAVTYHVRQWDYRLFAAILLFLSLPNVYQLYRVSLIGNEIPDTGSLAIVAQWQFVGLIVEVFQEAAAPGREPPPVPLLLTEPVALSRLPYRRGRDADCMVKYLIQEFKPTYAILGDVV